jgi:hypothetical protein
MGQDEKKSYTSTSVLGKIYDEVTSKESEIDPEISKLLIYRSHPPRSVDSRKGN